MTSGTPASTASTAGRPGRDRSIRVPDLDLTGGTRLVPRHHLRPRARAASAVPSRGRRNADADGQGLHRSRDRHQGPHQSKNLSIDNRARSLLISALRAPANALLKSSFTALRRVTLCPQRIGHIVRRPRHPDHAPRPLVRKPHCPLSGSVVGFRPPACIEQFGMSGDLVNSNLLLYDRTDESTWPQILDQAITGARRGKVLEEFRWRDAFPQTEALSPETGFVRRYGEDPYGSYNPIGGYCAEGSLRIFPGHVRGRPVRRQGDLRRAKVGEDRLAARKEVALERPVATARMGGTPVTFLQWPAVRPRWRAERPVHRPAHRRPQLVRPRRRGFGRRPGVERPPLPATAPGDRPTALPKHRHSSTNGQPEPSAGH